MKPHPTPIPSFRYEGAGKCSRWTLLLAALASIGLHAAALLSFNQKSPPPPPVIVDDGPLVQFEIPDIPEDEEEAVRELSDDPPIEAPTVQVPTLLDVPVINPESAFTQLTDLIPPPQLDASTASARIIPTNIQHGRPSASGLKNIFDMAALDRRPEPIHQQPPIFPPQLKQDYERAEVVVSFIITSKGDVVDVNIVRSDHRGFEEPSITAVMKWQFRPGMKGGKKVNTRAVQALQFKVTKE